MVVGLALVQLGGQQLRRRAAQLGAGLADRGQRRGRRRRRTRCRRSRSRAISSGIRTPSSRSCSSRPRASRSLAQKHPVGRSAPGSAAISLGDAAAGGDAHDRRVEHATPRRRRATTPRSPRGRPRAGRRPGGCRRGRRRTRSGAGPSPAGARRPDCRRARRRRRPSNRRAAARRGRRARPACRARTARAQRVVVATDRRDQDALDALLLELGEVAALAAQVAGRVADDEDRADVGHDRLDAVRDVGEERVGGVEHDERERAALARPQLRGRTRCGRSRARRSRRARAGRVSGATRSRPVEHVGDRADRHARAGRDLLDPDTGQLDPSLKRIKRFRVPFSAALHVQCNRRTRSRIAMRLPAW